MVGDRFDEQNRRHDDEHDQAWGRADGMTEWTTIGTKPAPVALSASTELPLTSSIVSMNARVRNPNEKKNNAKYPVRSLCPKENRRIIAHAATSILRNSVATPRASRANMPLAIVVREPNSANTNAKTDATVAAATDMSTVSGNLSRMSGSFSSAA